MGTGSVKPQPAGPGDGGPESPGRLSSAEPSVPDQERSPSTPERKWEAKAPTSDSGASGSLFTPRVPAQHQPAEADHERAKEAEPAGAGDARPADTATPLAAGGKPQVSRQAEDLAPVGPVQGEDGTRGIRDADQAEDADVAEDAAGASGDDDSDAGDLGAEAADDARDAAEPAEGVPSRAAATGDAPGAGDADQPGTTTESSKAAGKDGTTSAGDAASGRKPPLAHGRDPKPGEKPDKPGTDEGDGSGATPLDGEVTIVPGVSRYHRRGCILIRFLSDGDLETMTRGEAETVGSIPCKACQPEKPVSEY